MDHRHQDAVGLAIARRVANRLRESPAPLHLARSNLARWSEGNADAPGLMRCYREWGEILDRPVEEICRILCDPSEEGQRLRQNSPFAGALTPAEIWDLKDTLRRHASSAS